MAHGKKLILIIEDNPDVAEAIEATLTTGGFDAAIEHDGSSALVTLEAGLRPNLLVVDLMLGGGMDGLEFRTRQMHHPIPEIARIPAIAYSAYSDKALSAYALGMSFFLKPATVDNLRKIVETHALPHT